MLCWKKGLGLIFSLFGSILVWIVFVISLILFIIICGKGNGSIVSLVIGNCVKLGNWGMMSSRLIS